MKEKYAYVNFCGSKYPYIYKCGVDLKVGNIVEAPTCNYTMKGEAVVVKIKKHVDKDLPIEKNRILTITKIISNKDYDFKYDCLGFIKNYIKNKRTNKWKFDYEEEWEKVWKSSYGGKISKTNRSLTVSIGNYLEDGYFSYYAITDVKNFKIKLKFAEILLDELYYKKIDEEEFRKLFCRL